ncbi:Multidrug resistance-associated protein 7 [Frankliniella fusca]|uniref:ABC-type xenobiotic transporter n=1 Tax=Frankliniella fusca TaxID=407009 RepID=A0AAE1H4Z8_9NEOP|nr:Multidrug resistance-associated protein 7 [Frankliniella fusca]
MNSSTRPSLESWAFKWSWDEMCGPDGLVVWSTTHKDLGLCFQELCMKVPALALLAAVSAFYCGSQDRWVVRDPSMIRVIFFRSVVALILAIEPIVRVCYTIKDAPTSLQPVDYLLHGVESFAWLVHFGYILALRHRLGVSPRGPIVPCVLWTLILVLNIVSVRSLAREIREGNASQSVFTDYYADLISLCTHVVYLLTLLPGRGGTHAAYNRMYSEYYQRVIQSDERQALLGSRHAYSGFREEQEPGYLGVAMEDSSFSSRLLFHWVRPLMVKGVEGQLHDVDDLFDLPEELTPSYIHAQLEQAIGRSCAINAEEASLRSGQYGSVEAPSSTLQASSATPKPDLHVVTTPVSLLKALHSCFAWEFYSVGILKFLGDSVGFASPLLLNLLVKFIESKSEKKEDGYFFALGLCLAALVSALCNAHFNFLMAKVGMKIRSAIITLVYNKTLTLSTKSFSYFSSGEVVNFMSIDTDRIVNSCPSFHAFWSIPFQLVVTFYLLYTQVGLAFLAGVCFAVVLIPINKLIAMKIGSLSTKMMEKKDERVDMCSEILQGIRTLKMHVWEEHFLTKILRIRESELYFLKGRKYLDAMCVFFWATTPVIIAFLTFTCYILLGEGQLTAARVFTTIALLNMLIAPLNAFPWVLNGLVEAWVSIARIQKLITLPDLDLHEFYHLLPIDNDNIAIVVQNGKFEWGNERSEERFQLRNVNFTILKGQLIGVIGEVGSGKSTLLASMLAEPEKLSGVVAVDNSDQGFAYVAQHPWLQRGTIRDNILFGKPYDQSRYRSVLEACCLEDDLSILPKRDLYGIAEGATNLSGGQKARIALARAVYQDKAIYIFDDILSSVDPPVANTIFNKCILKLLKGRTRILCTHYAQCLRHADGVMKIADGRIVQIGSPTDVLPEEMENLALLDADILPPEKGDATKITRDEDIISEQEDDILLNEHRETGTVRFKVYRAYWRALSAVLSIAILIALILMQSSRNLSDWWMSYWVSESKVDPETFKIPEALTVYGAIAGLNAFFTLLRAFLFAYAGIHAATGLHKQLIKSIMRARIFFFDISPLGRILNRLSSDTYTVDDSLPFILNILLAQLFGLFGTMFITIYGLPWLSLILIPLVPIYHWLQEQYRQTSRELKRISSVTLSPVYSHFSESMLGLATIRAFRASYRFKRQNENFLDCNQRSTLASQAASQWLGLRLQLMGVAIISGVGFIAVIQHQFDVADPGIVGLAIAYALSVTSMLGGVVNAFTETEREMVAVERVHQYITDIQCEPQKSSMAVPYAWPSHGVIQFQNVILKYREHLAPSLKCISFETRPSEKIGVVGRTGAGKSSLIAALFRLVEISNGCIIIDSVDISKLRLHSLRSRLAVIPQDPFLFAGTVRDNIDPLKQYDDHEVYDVLNRCHIVDVVRRMGGLNAHVGPGGSSFSAGQKQLLCLTRAILQNAKVLCIDEATANVDHETDRLIQKTIRASFRQSTVITIAHRIETIMDSDRVLVLGEGEVLEFDSPEILMEDRSSHFYNLANHGKGRT